VVGEPLKTNVLEPPEPKDKLDAETVNGPEDETLDWDTIVWSVHEENVRRLRQRIFKATKAQDLATVRNLQRMMLRSWSNTLISIRQVTQRNAGRGTPGVDGRVVLTAPARMDLAVQVHRTARSFQPLPVRRVYTEGQWKTKAARNSRDSRSRSPGALPQRVGTRVGSPVRAQNVRVPAGPKLSGRDLGHPRHGLREKPAAPMDSGR